MSVRIKATLDGRPVTFICTYEFLQDMTFRQAMYDNPRTPDPTEEEVADWLHYDKMLGNPEFWEQARDHVKVESVYKPYLTPEEDNGWTNIFDFLEDQHRPPKWNVSVEDIEQ